MEPPHQALTSDEKRRLREELETMVDICNDQTRAAEDLERGMIDMALATRASQDPVYRSGSHRGMVTGLAPASCFISVDGVTEGRIPLSRLGRGRLTLDESESRVLAVDDPDGTGGGPDPGSEYEVLRLGQRVNCRIRSVELAGGRIDLSLGP